MFKYFKDTHIDSPALKSELCSIYISKRENAEAYDGLVDVFAAEGGYNYSLYLGCQVVDAQSGDPYPYYMHRVYKSDRASMVEGSDPHIWFGDPNDAYGDMIFVSVHEEFNIHLHAAYADMHINTLEDGSELPKGAEWRLTSAVVCAYDSSFEAQFKNAGVVYSNYKATYEIGAAPYLFSADGKQMIGEWLVSAPSANFVPCSVSYDSVNDEFSNNGESSNFAVDFVQNSHGNKFGFVPVSLDGRAFKLIKDTTEENNSRALGVDMQFDYGMPDNTDDILSKVIPFDYLELTENAFDIQIGNYNEKGDIVNTDPDILYDKAKGTLYVMLEEDPYSHDYNEMFYDIPLNLINHDLVVNRVQKIWDTNYTFIDDAVDPYAHDHIHVENYDSEKGSFRVTAAAPGVAYLSIFFKDVNDNDREYLATIRVKVLSRLSSNSQFRLTNEGNGYLACTLTKTQYDNMLKDFSTIGRYAVVIEADGTIGADGQYAYGFSHDNVGLSSPDDLTPSNIDGSGQLYNNTYGLENSNALPFKNGLVVYDWGWMQDNNLTSPNQINPGNASYIWLAEEPIADTVEYKMKAKLYGGASGEADIISIYPDTLSKPANLPSYFTIEKYAEDNTEGYEGKNTIFKCVISGYEGELSSEDEVKDFNMSLSGYRGIMISSLSREWFPDIELSDPEFGILEPFNVIETDNPDGSTSKTVIFFIVVSMRAPIDDAYIEFLDAPDLNAPEGAISNCNFALVGDYGSGIAWRVGFTRYSDGRKEISESVSTFPLARLVEFTR